MLFFPLSREFSSVPELLLNSEQVFSKEQEQVLAWGFQIPEAAKLFVQVTSSCQGWSCIQQQTGWAGHFA